MTTRTKFSQLLRPLLIAAFSLAIPQAGANPVKQPNDELVERLSNCAATHTNNVMLLRANKMNADQSTALADWFFERAVSLSNHDKAKGIFSERYMQYVESFKQIEKLEKENKPAFVNRYLAGMNRDMDRCDQFKAEVESGK